MSYQAKTFQSYAPFILIYLCALSFAPHVVCDEINRRQFEVFANQAISSKYVSRGLVINDYAVNQGEVIAEIATAQSSFYAGMWYNFDLHNENNYDFSITEINYTLGWTEEFNKVSFDLGLINYQLPKEDHADDSTTEIYTTLALNTKYSPAITIYYDAEDINSYYLSLAAGHSIELQRFNATWSVSFSLGYAGAGSGEIFSMDDEASPAYEPDDFDGGLIDALVVTTLDFNITDNLKTSFTLSASALMGDARINNDNDDNIFLSVGLDYTF